MEKACQTKIDFHVIQRFRSLKVAKSKQSQPWEELSSK